MALTAAKLYQIRPRASGIDVQAFKIANAEKIWYGALVALEQNVGADAGYLKNMDDLSGTYDTFVGIAVPPCYPDATTGAWNGNYVTGDTSASPKPECSVDISGPTLEYVSVAGASGQTNVGERVYASDESTLTLTATSYHYAIGVVVRWHTSTYCDVRLFSFMEYLAMQRGIIGS
jgi:hypothetical protein